MCNKKNIFCRMKANSQVWQFLYQNQVSIPDGFRYQFPTSVVKHISYNASSYQSKDTPADQTLTSAGPKYLNLLQDKDTNPWRTATTPQSHQNPRCWWIPLLRMALQWEEECLHARVKHQRNPVLGQRNQLLAGTHLSKDAAVIVQSLLADGNSVTEERQLSTR